MHGYTGPRAGEDSSGSEGDLRVLGENKSERVAILEVFQVCGDTNLADLKVIPQGFGNGWHEGRRPGWKAETVEDFQRRFRRMDGG